jgi:1-acyl-sn-glycerol-3-phosphate acyltransferase
VDPTLNRLTQQNNYRSPDRSLAWMARHLPTAVFYAQMFMVVLKASRLSKKGLYTNERWIDSSLTILRALESVGVRFEMDNLPVPGQLTSPCVFVGNHMSILETFVLPCLIQPHQDVTFVVKESLVAHPFFKEVMKSRNPVVVGRSNPRDDLRTVLREGQKRLDAHTSIIIFPQTTRSNHFDPRKFNSLGIKLAKRSRVPAIPIALQTDAWGLGRRLKDFGKIRPRRKVHIRFGKPLPVLGSGKNEHLAIVDFITRNLSTWR